MQPSNIAKKDLGAQERAAAGVPAVAALLLLVVKAMLQQLLRLLKSRSRAAAVAV
jgi:hypothetical protein